MRMTITTIRIKTKQQKYGEQELKGEKSDQHDYIRMWPKEGSIFSNNGHTPWIISIYSCNLSRGIPSEPTNQTFTFISQPGGFKGREGQWNIYRVSKKMGLLMFWTTLSKFLF